MISLLLYLIIGVIAGLSSGLLGIGGGTVTVPALLLIFTLLHFPESSVMHLAIGTSLASMSISTFFAMYFHHKKHNVVWSLLLPMLPGILVGSLIGAIVSQKLSGEFLGRMFGLFSCATGLYLASTIKSSLHSTSTLSRKRLSITSLFIAFFSNLLGIGGGVFTVPVLLYEKVQAKRAIGTSTASSFLISLLGTAGYLSFDRPLSSFPSSIGFVYLPAFFGISASSLIAAFYGTKLALSLPVQKIKRLFALALLAIGLGMLFR